MDLKKKMDELQQQEEFILEQAENNEIDFEEAQEKMAAIQLELFKLKIQEAKVKDPEVEKILLEAFNITNKEDAIIAELEASEDIDGNMILDKTKEIMNAVEGHSELATTLRELQIRKDGLLAKVPKRVLEKIGMDRLYIK